MIRLHFEKLSRYNRLAELITGAIPFKKGALKYEDDVYLTDGTTNISVQKKATAWWDDKSVKWLHIAFLADLPGNSSKDYWLNIGTAPCASLSYKVECTQTKDGLCIDTGVLKATLSQVPNTELFKNIMVFGEEYDENVITGPILTNEQGESFKAFVGENGFVVEEQNELFIRLATCGKHLSTLQNKTFFDYDIILTFFAGKPWIQMDYRFTNKEEEENHIIKHIELLASLNGQSPQVSFARSNYSAKITSATGEEGVFGMATAKDLLVEASEQFAETLYGVFLADYRSQTQGLCVEVFQAHQNCPKALRANDKGICVGILPKESDPLLVYQGVAKTHTIFFHFHNKDEEMLNLINRAYQFEMPDRFVLDSAYYQQTQVFEDVCVANPNADAEFYLTVMADSVGKAFGMLHWGDMVDAGYTNVGRGGGKPVWTNNEYDMPHAATLMYIRSQERRYLDKMLVAAKHWMDVDIAHFNHDPLRANGQIMHGPLHVLEKVIPSHEWVEGLLDYYHQTGEQRALDICFGIGQNICRQLETEQFQKKGEISARETGWALRTFVALYQETYDHIWLEKCNWIVGHFRDWKQAYGQWLAPYTNHTTIRVPFMISIAVGSLMRYNRVCPSEELKQMVLDAVDDMIENCRMPNGLFYYKELPSLRRVTYNAIPLEALAYAYELTGKKKYLEAGLPLYEKIIHFVDMPSNMTKQVIAGFGTGDSLVQGAGTKMFAQSHLPVAVFYKQLELANML